VATGCEAKELFLWDIHSGTCKSELSSHRDPYAPKPGSYNEIFFFKEPFNNSLLAATDSPTIKKAGVVQIWDFNKETLLTTLTDHTNSVLCAHQNSSGNMFLTAAQDRTIRFYDTKTCKQTRVINTGKPDFNSATFSPCETFVQACGEDNSTLVYDYRFASKPLYFLNHDASPIKLTAPIGVTCAQWSRCGSFLVTTGEDRMVRVWNVKLGDPAVKVLKGHNMSTASCALSYNADFIISGGDDGLILLFGLPGSKYKITTKSEHMGSSIFGSLANQ